MHYYKSLRIPFRVDNPTDEARHEMLKYMLKKEKRVEDINNIINILSPPKDITTICPFRTRQEC